MCVLQFVKLLYLLPVCSLILTQLLTILIQLALSIYSQQGEICTQKKLLNHDLAQSYLNTLTSSSVLRDQVLFGSIE